MRSLLLAAPLTLAFVFAAAPATAGDLANPELVDVAGDCAFAPGNEYLDVVAAWISDETEVDFQVNLALAKWTEQPAIASGYTVQFTHQDVQWGVAALYDPTQGGWDYSTGYVGEDDINGFNDTSGSFTPGEPAILTMAFPKDLFPHTQTMDHAVRDFYAGTADFKAAYPLFVAEAFGAPVDPYGGLVFCDEARSDAVYTFQVGEHAMAAMDEDAETMDDGETLTTTDVRDDEMPEEATAAGDPAGDNETPAPGLVAAAGALAAATAVRRRRRA